MDYLKYMLGLTIVLVMVILVTGERERDDRTRRSRLLSFNSLDGEVSINLEFSIPFIKIPVQKAMETFGVAGLSLPPVSINLAALALGGALVVGTAVVIPLIMKSYADVHPNQHYARLLDNTKFGADSVLDFTNQLLMDSHTLQGCSLRIACWTAQTSPNNAAVDILNTVSRNSLLSSMINSTAVVEAISSGREGRDCTNYGPCSLREDHVPMLMRSIGAFGKRRSRSP